MDYNYNTYKEIRQQPKVWLKTLESIRARKQEIKAFRDKYLNLGYEAGTLCPVNLPGSRFIARQRNLPGHLFGVSTLFPARR